jgi:GntR family transcriptional regulator/MocR family aminotransferase
LQRRRELLEWANACDAYILEDDYDSEFTIRLRPQPALQSLDRHERVIYIGSFSKTLAPAVRIGYLIAPPHLASAFRAARACSSLGVSLHLQAALATFINRGYFARHVRRMNVIYERRRSILRNILEPLSRSGFKIGPMEVGLHVAIVAIQRFDDRALSHIGHRQRFVALSSLCIKRRDCSGFVLGFTNGNDEEVAQAARSFVKILSH